MTLENVEVPDPRRTPGQEETLRGVTRTNRPVYLTVIVVLGVVLVVGVTGWLLLAARDKTVPDGLGVILGTVAGGLVGLVSDRSTN